MNNISKGAWIIFLSFAIGACEKKNESSTTGPSDDGTDAYSLYVQELDSLIHPLSGASPDLNYDDLQPLSYLGNSRIVGLGEATHGTKEFFQLKHRIFRYLVENHNYKIFGFESDLGESIYFDRYVCSGQGDINVLMNTIMHFWTWRTEEVKDLLEWMRTYNEGKTEEEKIHFIGLDCQFMTYQPALLLDYFNRVKPEFIDEIEPTLNMISAMNNTSLASVLDYYTNMDVSRKQEISDSLDTVLTKLDEIESELISKSSHFEYRYIRRLVRNMQQVNDVIFASTHNNTGVNYRDKYMAENAVWLSALFGESTKIAVWAHNLHVGSKYSSMGYHLRRELDDLYQIVGFSFSKGSFTAVTQTAPGSYSGLNRQTINSNPPQGSLNHLFYKAEYNNFILKVADILTDSELGNWISASRPFLMIGAMFNGDPADYYSDIYLREYFDVVINYDKTSAAVKLN